MRAWVLAAVALAALGALLWVGTLGGSVSPVIAVLTQEPSFPPAPTSRDVSSVAPAALSQRGPGPGAATNASAACATDPRLHFPLSTLEQELDRLAQLTDAVMAEIGATHWPVDATLLGLMRNGRVATDRDLDYAIHANFSSCAPLLQSLRARFAARAKVKYFKVAMAKRPGTREKMGRYGMVRIVRQFGTYDTGPDFNCVFMDDPRGPSFFTHKGELIPLPPGVLPLKRCLMYGRAVPCPGDGYALLATLKPRYDGCMVYPHCLGDAARSHKGCLTPHPPMPLADFVASTRLVRDCGFTSLADHYDTHPDCRKTFTPQCKQDTGLCFIQPFQD